MQAWLSASLPIVETTIGTTSFHSVICIAKIAKHTHSWIRIGRGPVAKAFKAPGLDFEVLAGHREVFG